MCENISFLIGYLDLRFHQAIIETLDFLKMTLNQSNILAPKWFNHS